jgi:NADPH:quinone reductase-like Zn-dependent oxidoreductase
MPCKHNVAVTFVEKQKAELVPIEAVFGELKPTECEGRTVVSLISAGTEVVGLYSGHYVHDGRSVTYPTKSGYATVIEVTKVGSAVTDIRPGEMVLACRNHQRYHRFDRAEALRIPSGVPPERAVFARMVKVSMPAFVHTRIRPPEGAIVTGLGAVGFFAAQLAGMYGYHVVACDPDERRRRIAQEHGIENTANVVPVPDTRSSQRAGLGLECSGHEQAVADVCGALKLRGELFLVGVPWVARTDMLAQKILHAVFYNYIVLQSGWEGEMPRDPALHSSAFHLQAALRWLSEGRIRVTESVYRMASPENCQQQYQDILHGRLDRLTTMFDWRMLE